MEDSICYQDNESVTKLKNNGRRDPAASKLDILQSNTISLLITLPMAKS